MSILSAQDNRQDIKVLLAAPRGFCAGVDRAIQIVEKALDKYGAPVYVRHEIVHNKYVVESLRKKGAIFVEELSEIPDDGQPVIFSAHGVPKKIPEKAKSRNMFYIDATCPLVSKVHKEAERHFAQGNQVVLIGHQGHPEVEGTMGQLPDGAVLLVETVEDVANLKVEDESKIAFCTQTTLSIDDTKEIVEELQKRFVKIISPHREDICYATTNRQEAVKEIAEKCDALMVIGAPNSSNSNRLVEVGLNYGSKKSCLVQRGADVDFKWLEGVEVLGLTAGASAPEVLIIEVIDKIKEHYNVDVKEVSIREENVVFNIPKILRDSDGGKKICQ